MCWNSTMCAVNQLHSPAFPRHDARGDTRTRGLGHHSSRHINNGASFQVDEVSASFDDAAVVLQLLYSSEFPPVFDAPEVAANANKSPLRPSNECRAF
eukprot:2046905-Rhodomonas_salina.2